MATRSLASRASASRSTLQVLCAAGAALVGLALLLYAGYVIPGRLGSQASSVTELLAFVAIVGLLSVLAAVGYWLGKTWAWFAHLLSVLGQLLFPGSLFELKLDLYHMVGWAAPVISLLILILMGVMIRRRRRA
ncbi:MAG: hypothetical protein ACM3JD_07060 [Rudaea sp.]